MKKQPLVIFFIFILGISFVWAEGHNEPNMTHRMMMLVIQLGIIIFAAKIGNILFEKMKMPGVLGELAAGMIIGPYLLGGIPFYGFAEGLFPSIGNYPVTPELYGFCTVASIILLFMVGMETDLSLFMKFSVAGSFVGIFGVVFSFLGGDLLAVYLSGFISSKPLSFLSPEALFLGVISTATSVGITARVLSEKRKMDSSEGVTILAGAVIDDVLGIIILAVVFGILTASKASGTIDWAHIGLIAVKTISIWLVATALGLILSRKISNFLKTFKSRSSIALMGFGLALILAGLFEEAGLAMIIGAYIMGLSISGTDVRNVIQEKLHPIYDFLVPIFFCVMGMLVDFKALNSPPIIIFGLIYSAVAIIAKIVGCSIPSLFFNFNTIGALRIGIGMVPRGEVALIVAGIGLTAGFLPSNIFGVSIIMTLITTLASPPLLVAVFNDKKGMRSEIKAEEESSIKMDFPSSQINKLVLDNLINLFESEGFYVHLIDHEKMIYQLRKDVTIISLSLENKSIIFNCKKENEHFIYTSLYMVMGDIENTLKGLLVPLDKKEIAKKIQQKTNKSKNTFDLSIYLKSELIEPNLKGNNKEEIINELIKLVSKNKDIKDLSQVEKAVWERENGMSTGMQHGIAIPHGKTDAVNRLICAIGIKKEGIDFDSLDGEPSKIFIITLSPKNAPAPHVQFMSAVSQVLTEENRKKILSIKSAKELYKIFTGKDADTKKKKGFF